MKVVVVVCQWLSKQLIFRKLNKVCNCQMLKYLKYLYMVSCVTKIPLQIQLTDTLKQTFTR